MNRFALYHDHDELKCETVREAIKARAITDGEVICGDIKQLAANDVRGFRRCHFFCGGGFWDLALNQAGWGVEPVWTGSCPCPSFSAAGKGKGFDDPRHLWPDWARLIGECRPSVVFGEQVGAAIGHGWLDLVQADLEAQAYAVGKIVFGAHSVGAPHIRQRLYFVADTGCASRSAKQQHEPGQRSRRQPAETDGAGPWARSSVVECADAQHDGLHSTRRTQAIEDCHQPREWLLERDGGTIHAKHATGDGRIERRAEPDGRCIASGCGAGECADAAKVRREPVSTGLHAGGDGTRVDEAEPVAESGDDQPDISYRADAQPSERRSERKVFAETHGRHGSGGSGELVNGLHPVGPRPQGHGGDERPWREPGWLDPQSARSVSEAGATRGFWGECDWWYGRDGKFRPIGPGLQPLAHGSPARVGRLRLYGDAIVVAQAQAFIEAYRSVKEEPYAHPDR